MKKGMIVLLVLAWCTSIVSAADDIPSDCNIMEKINEVEHQLALAPLTVGTKDYTYYEVRANTRAVFRDPEKQIALGLMNRTTCVTRMVVVTKRGDKLTRVPSGYEIDAVKRANGIRWNSWATQFEVSKPEGWIVISNKYPLVRDEIVGREKKRIITNITYSPFIPEFERPEFITAGQEYARSIVASVTKRLRDANIMSLAYPGTLVADVPELKAEYIERLFPIEHMDQTEFILDRRWTANRIYAVIGTNGDRMAVRTCSPASACGPWQFTKGTWQLMWRTYPQANLLSDFAKGAQDAVESATAAFLLNDYNLSVIKKSLPGTQFDALIADAKLTEELLAAAYNTGVSRTIAVFKAYAKKKTGDWIQYHGGTTKSRFVSETKGYIAKLRYLRDEWPNEVVARAKKPRTSRFGVFL